MDRTIEIRDVRYATANEWQSIWESCTYSTYFHSPGWADLWAQYKGYEQPAALLIRFSDDKSALFPLSRQKIMKGLSKRVLSSPGGTYGGWISADEMCLSHGSLLARYVQRKFANLVWRENPYAPYQDEVLEPSRIDNTQRLDLSAGTDGIWAGFSQGHRRAVRLSEKNGVTTRILENLEEWQEYYMVYQDSLRRWGKDATSKYPWVFFSMLYEMRDDNVKLWGAFDQNQLLAGALMLYSPRIAIYWHGATLESAFSRRPSNLLMKTMIDDAICVGLDWFDFNPSGGHEGVRRFKEGFGARSTPAPVTEKRSRLGRVYDNAADYLYRRNSGKEHSPDMVNAQPDPGTSDADQKEPYTLH